MFCCLRTCLNGNLRSPMTATHRSREPEIHLDAAFMGPEVILLSNQLRITGTGGALSTAPLVQSKSYFEVKIQQTGIWSVGLATRQTDLSKKIGGTDRESWCLCSDNSTRFNDEVFRPAVVTTQPQANGNAGGGLIGIDEDADDILLTVNQAIAATSQEQDDREFPGDGDIIGVTFDHIELNFYFNGKSLEVPFRNVKGNVYPVVFVGNGAILDVILDNFTYGPPPGFDKIMIEQSLLQNSRYLPPMSGEIIQIHVGQAGVQIANACWELYCIEHGINADGCVPAGPKDDSYKPFFSITSARKVIPRVIMVDSEPTVIDEIRTGCYRQLFHPNTLISGKEDCGSNFACGYYHIGSELIDCTMDNIRRLVEACSNVRGFLMFRAIGGGTGSGLGNLIFDRIQSSYGKTPKMEFIIFPSPSMSPLIVEPYNAILSTHSRLDISECSFIIDNEALYDICSQKLEVKSPTYTNLNRIIAQAVSSFTSPLRFGSTTTNFTFSDCHTNLVPYPRIHFPLVSYAPLLNPVKASYGDLSTEQVTFQCFETSCQLVRCNPADGKNLACVLLYRGDVSSGEVSQSLKNIKKNNAARFVDWSPTSFKVAINSRPASFVIEGDLAATNRTILGLTNNTAIQKAWCRLMIKYNLLISRKAFLHHFAQHGMEEDTLRDASENVCTLIRDYQKADGISTLAELKQ